MKFWLIPTWLQEFEEEASYNIQRFRMVVGKCAKCGKIRQLVKNHKDGNNNNNDKGNIEHICDECHAEYHHYPKGQNTGISIRGN